MDLEIFPPNLFDYPFFRSDVRALFHKSIFCLDVITSHISWPLSRMEGQVRKNLEVKKKTILLQNLLLFQACIIFQAVDMTRIVLVICSCLGLTLVSNFVTSLPDL